MWTLPEAAGVYLHGFLYCTAATWVADTSMNEVFLECVHTVLNLLDNNTLTDKVYVLLCKFIINLVDKEVFVYSYPDTQVQVIKIPVSHLSQ